MTAPHRALCPFCGNDRVVQVTTSRFGEGDRRRAFCAGSLGCHTWWDPESGQLTDPSLAPALARAAG